MKEIMTVQVGGFANFIGSHFWNFQDEIIGRAGEQYGESIFNFSPEYLDMDVVYRSGQTWQGKVTYTPRLVSFDCQGSLGSMSAHGTLYDEGLESDIITWEGKVSTWASEPYKKNMFLQRLHKDDADVNSSVDNGIASDINDQDIVEHLDNEVQFWTDFSKVHYHPQSLFELSELWEDIREFNSYGLAKDVISKGFQGEEMGERIRFFVEECDHLQGFQFVAEDSGGFSALTAEILEVLKDEYTNSPVLLFSVRPPQLCAHPMNQKQKMTQELHEAVSFSRLSSLCDLIVPLGSSLSNVSPNLCINITKPYHSSGIYAASLHTLGLPWRFMRGSDVSSPCIHGGVDMIDMIQVLGHGRQSNIAVLDISIPAQALSGREDKLTFLHDLHPLTPDIAKDTEDSQAIEFLTVLGANAPGVGFVPISKVLDSVDSAYEHLTTKPKACHLSVAHCPLPIPLSFPSIFGNRVGMHGEILKSPVPGQPSRGPLDVHSVPVITRLSSSSAILPFLGKRAENLKRHALRGGAGGLELVRSWGFGKEDVEDFQEMLLKMIAGDESVDISSDSD